MSYGPRDKGCLGMQGSEGIPRQGGVAGGLSKFVVHKLRTWHIVDVVGALEASNL